MTQLEDLERYSRLWHIAEACRHLTELLESHTATDLEADWMLRSVIERQLIIIGEALRRLTEVDPTTAGKISDVPQIIAFRNQLVHNYPLIDYDKVWSVIRENVPILLGEVRALLPPA